MSAHTPGPWFAGRALRNGQECIVGDGDTVVCLMPDHTIGCTFKREDALLIAAAPKMLAALRELIDIEGPKPATAAWASKVRRLIGKAEGEHA